MLYTSTQLAAVRGWERALARRLEGAPPSSTAKCPVPGCRRSAATDRDVLLMVAEWRHHFGTCHLGEQWCYNTN